MTRFFSCFAALSLALATLAGAAASHALALDAGSLHVFETAVEFQFFHGLGLLCAALIGARAAKPAPVWAAGWLFVAGTLLFCGSLYATALGGRGFVGALAPIGGLSFVAGWLVLAWSLWRLAPAARSE